MTTKILLHHAGRLAGAESARRDFRNGNGGAHPNIPGLYGRNQPHARGGNHSEHHGRDGNPKG